MKLSSKIAAFTASATAFALSAAAYSELSIKTTEYTLKTDKVSSPIRAAVLSDLHFSVFGKDNKRLIEAIRKTNPDIILLAGDFFDFHNGRSNKEIVTKTLCSLCDIADVYMTPGNHDLRYNIKTGENCLGYAEHAGVTVLNGEYRDIKINGQNVRIGGIFDHASYLEDFDEAWRKSAAFKFLKDFENTDSLSLLLMHRPNTFIYANDDFRIDAVFCGHDHGGIWRLPFIGGVYAPEQGIFPEYDKGEYDFGKTKMFLSSGLEGYYLVPRLFNRPEIIKLEIRSEE